MNIWGTRNTLIYVVFQGPIVTYHKIVEPWRGMDMMGFSGILTTCSFLSY